MNSQYHHAVEAVKQLNASEFGLKSLIHTRFQAVPSERQKASSRFNGSLASPPAKTVCYGYAMSEKRPYRPDETVRE